MYGKIPTNSIVHSCGCSFTQGLTFLSINCKVKLLQASLSVTKSCRTYRISCLIQVLRKKLSSEHYLFWWPWLCKDAFKKEEVRWKKVRIQTTLKEALAKISICHLFKVHSVILSLHFRLHLKYELRNMMEQSLGKQYINSCNLCAQWRAIDSQAWRT